MDRQIFASIEIIDGHIRFLIGEYYNTRFNILNVTKQVTESIKKRLIVNRELLVHDIQNVINTVKNKLGVEIYDVILCIPSKDVFTHNVRVNVDITSVNNKVTSSEINEAIDIAKSHINEENRIFVNYICNSYYVDGVLFRKKPKGEKGNKLEMDISLLYADLNTTYEYVKLIESINLKVKDIYLDSYACAKEGALFEKSVSTNIIMIKLERHSTNLTVLSKCNYDSNTSLNIGLLDWYTSFMNKYNIKEKEASNIIKYNINLSKTKHEKTPIHLWSVKGEVFSVSETDVYKSIKEPLNNWINEIENLCKPIIESDKTEIIIVGEGADLYKLDELISKRLNVNCSNYAPLTSLGAREGNDVATLGCLYAYKEDCELFDVVTSSIDLIKFEELLNNREHEETIIKKIIHKK